MGIVFDEAVAERLFRVLNDAGARVRVQSWQQRNDAPTVLSTFEGTYAKRFQEASRLSYQDGVKLAQVLNELSISVQRTIQSARAEKQRLTDLTAWRERERQRAQERLTTPLAGFLADALAPLDPRPSEYPIPAPPISAPFTAQDRSRAGGDSSGGSSWTGGSSSAEPAKLRDFAGKQRADNAAAADSFARVRTVWSAFLAACPWARIETATFLGGFEKYLIENTTDTQWLEQIAEAFERAGGQGPLSDLALEVATAAATAAGWPAALQRLLAPGLSVTQIKAAWTELGFTNAEIKALPLVVQYRLANLNGLPAAPRDVASRAVLAAAIKDPQQVHQLMGLTGTGLSLTDFTTQIEKLQQGLAKADSDALKLPESEGNRIAQMLGFGVQDEALIAAVSLGDLDTAATVAVNVQGAGSSIADMPGRVQAANDLFNAAYYLKPGSFAVVSWLGYRSPALPDVGSTDPARTGATNLANFLDGINTSRTEPPTQFTVLGHSYGSTTVAEALQWTTTPVDAFISYGSVGFTNDTKLEDLNVQNLYATEAKQDNIAMWGRNLTLWGRTNPRDIPGVQEFSSEAGDGTKAVTGHNMTGDGKNDIGYLSPDSTSLNNIARIVANGTLP